MDGKGMTFCASVCTGAEGWTREATVLVSERVGGAFLEHDGEKGGWTGGERRFSSCEDGAEGRVERRERDMTEIMRK
jgi:hypothetical protein